MSTMLNESVELSCHDPGWSDIARAERRRLSIRLSIPLEDIEHIGSTAVPNLVAKPIVDLMLGVTSFPPPDEIVASIQELGYEALGEAGVPGRLYFRRRVESPFNLHVVLIGGDHWRQNLAFRELLKTDSAARERYAQAKIDALERGCKTLLEYSDAKQKVIGDLLSKFSAG